MKSVFIIIFLVILTGFDTTNSRFVVSDYVPDRETAIKIAEAVWLPIYGDGIYKKTPFKAYLTKDSIWHVTGSLPRSGRQVDSHGDTVIVAVFGGVPHAFIDKKSGCIVHVFHSK